MSTLQKDCMKCGAPRNEGSQFCGTCGTRFRESLESPAPQPARFEDEHFKAYRPTIPNTSLAHPAARQGTLTKLAIGIGGAVIGIAVISAISGRATAPAPVAPMTVAVPAPVAPAAPIAPVAPPIPSARQGPSFHEIDSKMDDRLTGWTQAQKQAYWLSVSGTQVTWTGEVKEVEISSGGHLSLKCNPKTWGSDVEVDLDGSQIDSLSNINKAQRVTIKGILQSHSIGGYKISQGQVVG